MSTSTSTSYPLRTLLLTSLASFAAGGAAITAYIQWQRRKKRKNLNLEVKRSIESHLDSDHANLLKPQHVTSHKDVSLRGFDSEYDEELIREQLARNYSFFGEHGMSTVRAGRVAVIGCGGVGSWAAVMLVRSGVSYIRLVDFDQVTLSSLNRHATAQLADVGTPKVYCIERTLKQISKWVHVDAHMEIWRRESGEHFLQDVDWVIDAIDNISTKVDLLQYCYENKIKVFSSMGSGAKCDPTRVHISDISHTTYDPLARSVRQHLRLRKVFQGIPVVYSSEVPDVKLLPLDEEELKKGAVQELSAFDDFRVRILPVLGPLPAIFGLNIATYIICDLAKKPIQKLIPTPTSKKQYEKLIRDLRKRESAFTGEHIIKLSLDEDDATIIVEELQGGRSIIPPNSVPAIPTLTRWDPDLPLTITNCVLMDAQDAAKHSRECLSVQNRRSPVDVWGPGAAKAVKDKAQELRQFRNWVL